MSGFSAELAKCFRQQQGFAFIEQKAQVDA
jgi:hypothetical protein